MRNGPNRIGLILLGATLFGIAVAVLKGGDAGIRDSLGNISAPWLLLPYFAGLTGKGPLRGASLGLMASLAALAGFYVAEAFVLDLGGHPVLTNLALTLGAGRMYFAAGVLSGPVMGALGGLRVRHHRMLTAAVVGLALAGEPLAVFAWLGSQSMSPADTGLVVSYQALWVGELTLGVALALGILVKSLPGRRIQPGRTV